ncbi:MAG: hypothetical protein R3330_11080, partial [Saprospiraceae bacterium]|nr:hypothetical protein [Saprospiraceae bacterium]
GRIQGWWASREDVVLSPPTYAAYRAYLQAQEVWRSNDSLAEVRLRESISLDSTFLDAHFLLMDLFYNHQRYADRDSMIKALQPRTATFSHRQSDLYAYHRTDAAGDLVGAYRYFLKELNRDILDPFYNTSGMVMTIGYVNQLDRGLSLFRMLPPDSLDFEDCTYCQTRLTLATWAFAQKGMIDSSQWVAQFIPPVSVRNVNTMALPAVILGDTARLTEMLNLARESDNINEEQIWNFMVRYALIAGHDSLSQQLARTALAHFDTTYARAVTVECNYWLGNYGKVMQIIKDAWLPAYAAHEYVAPWASRAIARTGTSEEMDAWHVHLDSLEASDPYHYGKYAYIRGVISSIRGKEDRAMDHLLDAYRKGHDFSYSIPCYQTDPDLMPLFDHPRWEGLMDPLNN